MGLLQGQWAFHCSVLTAGSFLMDRPIWLVLTETPSIANRLSLIGFLERGLDKELE